MDRSIASPRSSHSITWRTPTVSSPKFTASSGPAGVSYSWSSRLPKRPLLCSTGSQPGGGSTSRSRTRTSSYRNLMRTDSAASRSDWVAAGFSSRRPGSRAGRRRPGVRGGSRRRLRGGGGEEVREKGRPGRGEDRLGMELDPLDGRAAMPHRHDLSVVRGGADLEVGRHRFGVDRQGMVASYDHRIRQAFEDRPAIVMDDARLSMEDPRCMLDDAAEGRRNSLVAQAHPEGRRCGAQLPQDVPADAEVAGVRRMARSRGEDERVGLDRLQFVQRDRVVAEDDRLRPELSEGLVEIVHEGIVIVDDEDLHHGLRAPADAGTGPDYVYVVPRSRLANARPSPRFEWKARNLFRPKTIQGRG